MITIKFWNFSKRDNSTKQPSATGAQSYSCALKEGCSVLTPEIILTLPATTNPSSYTYAQIADFNRYYFVSGWTYSRGEWTASLKVDTLATYKSSIGSLSKYVLRAAAAGNGDIVDTMFPTTGKTTSVVNSITNPFSATSLSQGCYILNAIGDESPLFLCVPPSMWTTLWHAIFTNGRYTQWVDVGGGDLSQYIKSCFWLPLPPTGSSAGIVSIGHIWLDDVAGVLQINSPIHVETTTIAIPKHPQSSTRGNFLNSGGYASYHLNLVPFGSVDIPADRLYDVTSITIIYRVDYTTGEVEIKITDSNGYDVTTMSGNLAVPIEYGRSVSKSTLGAVIAAAPSAVSAGAQAVAGNYGGALMSAGGALIAGARSLVPFPVSGGSQGSIAGLAYSQFLTSQFVEVAPANWTDLGRPLCSTVTLNTLSGYIQCADGECDISAYESERTQISSYLTGGFFYE